MMEHTDELENAAGADGNRVAPRALPEADGEGEEGGKAEAGTEKDGEAAVGGVADGGVLDGTVGRDLVARVVGWDEARTRDGRGGVVGPGEEDVVEEGGGHDDDEWWLAPGLGRPAFGLRCFYGQVAVSGGIDGRMLYHVGKEENEDGLVWAARLGSRGAARVEDKKMEGSDRVGGTWACCRDIIIVCSASWRVVEMRAARVRQGGLGKWNRCIVHLEQTKRQTWKIGRRIGWWMAGGCHHCHARLPGQGRRRQWVAVPVICSVKPIQRCKVSL